MIFIEQDYPSVGQIVQMLHEKDVSVIFAITQQRLNTYRVRHLHQVHKNAHLSVMIF